MDSYKVSHKNGVLKVQRMLKDSLTLAALFFPLESSGTVNWNIFFCPRPLEFCGSETRHSWEPVMSLCIFPQGMCCGLTSLEWIGWFLVCPGPTASWARPSLSPCYPPTLSYQGQQAQGRTAGPQQPPRTSPVPRSQSLALPNVPGSSGGALRKCWGCSGC